MKKETTQDETPPSLEEVKHIAASILGRMGGLVRSERKAKSRSEEWYKQFSAKGVAARKAKRPALTQNK